MDRVSKEKRSWNMSQIKGSNTKPEIIVRSYLHKLGFRFRLHDKNLPGRPDVVLKKYNTVVFINGCYWHRHGCKRTTTPKTNTEFWVNKFFLFILLFSFNYIIVQFHTITSFFPSVDLKIAMCNFCMTFFT